MNIPLVLLLEAGHILMLVSDLQVARELAGNLLAIFAQEGLRKASLYGYHHLPGTRNGGHTKAQYIFNSI